MATELRYDSCGAIPESHNNTLFIMRQVFAGGDQYTGQFNHGRFFTTFVCAQPTDGIVCFAVQSSRLWYLPLVHWRRVCWGVDRGPNQRQRTYDFEC
jgi:hypothetical protein